MCFWARTDANASASIPTPLYMRRSERDEHPSPRRPKLKLCLSVNPSLLTVIERTNVMPRGRFDSSAILAKPLAAIHIAKEVLSIWNACVSIREQGVFEPMGSGSWMGRFILEARGYWRPTDAHSAFLTKRENDEVVEVPTHSVASGSNGDAQVLTGRKERNLFQSRTGIYNHPR